MTGFPSEEDIREHSEEIARQRRLEQSIGRRCEQVNSPEGVADVMVELARMQFRDGEPTVHVEVWFELENFRGWVDAQNVKPKLMLGPRSQTYRTAEAIRTEALKKLLGMVNVGPTPPTIRLDEETLDSHRICLQLTMEVVATS